MICGALLFLPLIAGGGGEQDEAQGRYLYRGQCVASCPDTSGVGCPPCLRRVTGSRDAVEQQLWVIAERRDEFWANVQERAANDPEFARSAEYREQSEVYQDLLAVDNIAENLSGDRSLNIEGVNRRLLEVRNSVSRQER